MNRLAFLLLMISATVAISDELIVTKDSDGGLIGDPVNILMEATVPEGSFVEWPAVSDTTGSLEIITEQIQDTSLSGGSIKITKLYTVSAYDSVNAVVPGFTLFYTRPGLDAPNTLQAPGFELSFTTVAVDTTAPIKDIRDIKSVEYTDYTWWILGGVILLGLIIAFFIFRKAKEQEPAQKLTKKDYLPPHKRALARLDEIEKKAVWKENKYKDHHTAISDTVKQYIESRYKIGATDMTTGELSDWLIRSDADTEASNQLIHWLSTGDLIKFAKYQPLPEENTQPIKASREFVLATAIITDMDGNDKIKQSEGGVN
jgi:hypothetical protein